MSGAHRYEIAVTWTGNRGAGTAGYRQYDRAHTIQAEGKAAIAGSADPIFRGDPACYNPEELLVASLAACHMLWYLHLCADAGVVVTAYCDTAEGAMQIDADGGGRFVEVVLRPRVTVTDGSAIATAERLHAEASAKCFIANSVRFPVRHEPQAIVVS